MNSYISVTWLLTILVHPIILSLYFSGTILSPAENGGAALVISLYLALFSLPSLLLSLLAGYLIRLLPAPVLARFFAWLLTAPLIIVLNLVFLSVLFDGNGIRPEDLELTVPAMITVTGISLVRVRFFFRYCETRKNLSNEYT